MVSWSAHDVPSIRQFVPNHEGKTADSDLSLRVGKTDPGSHRRVR